MKCAKSGCGGNPATLARRRLRRGWLVIDFDVTANAGGFSDGAFDGRYLYLVPDSNAVVNYNRVLRLTASMTSTTRP